MRIFAWHFSSVFRLWFKFSLWMVQGCPRVWVFNPPVTRDLDTVRRIHHKMLDYSVGDLDGTVEG